MNAPRSRCDLLRAPEALTLDILDAALHAAENAFSVLYPELDELGATHPTTIPPPASLMAALIAPRLAELRGLLAWYRTTYRRSDARSPFDDDPF